MHEIKVGLKTQQKIRQLKRALDLHSDDKAIQLLLEKYYNKALQARLTPTEEIVKEIILGRLKANDGKTFFNDFAVAVSQRLDVPFTKAKSLVESILPRIPTVQNTGDDWYQLS